MRHFSDKQVVKILRRAAELESGEATPTPTGSTEKDLVQIGSELGLSQISIEAAIQESSGEPAGFDWLGGPTSIETMSTFDGTLDDEAWQGMVADFRKSFGRIGESAEVGGAREWSGGQKELDPIHISVLPKNGQVQVRVTSSLGPASVIMGLVFIVPLLITIASSLDSSKLSESMKVPLILGTLAGLALLFRAIFAWTTRRRQRAISDVLYQISQSLKNQETPLDSAPAIAQMEAPLDLTLENGRS